MWLDLWSDPDRFKLLSDLTTNLASCMKVMMFSLCWNCFRGIDLTQLIIVEVCCIVLILYLSALYWEVFLLINPLVLNLGVGVHFQWSPDDMGNNIYITLSAPMIASK